MFKTLHGKLSGLLLVLLCVVGLLLVQVSAITTRGYVREVNQNLNRGLASYMAGYMGQQNLLPADLGTNADAQKRAKAEISHLMVLNPDIEIYILDERGGIVAYSSAPGQVKSREVSLSPIQRFWAQTGPMPVLGDDPRWPGEQKVFSVAPIPPKGSGPDQLRGYIYIILGGQSYDSAAAMVERSYILRWSAWTALASLVLVFALGLLFFFVLTRPLRSLTRRVEAFGAGGFDAPADDEEASSLEPTLSMAKTAGQAQESKTPRDEIARLATAYSEMARCLREQISQRREAEVRRRELVSNVSHDLRTPLAALRGYLETVLMKQKTLAPEEQEQYLSIALKHAGRLEKLVMELFELAKLDSPEAAPEMEPFSLPELVQDVVQGFHLGAQTKGVQLEAPFVDGLPFVRGDIGLIERALENPLENALRHTPEGGTVRVGLEREGDFLAVRIADTGSGIAPEDLPHIFDRSYRAARHRPDPGAGLGLAITRRIVELHGGSAEAHSEPGHGTTLILRLPVVNAETQNKTA